MSNRTLTICLILAILSSMCGTISLMGHRDEIEKLENAEIEKLEKRVKTLEQQLRAQVK